MNDELIDGISSKEEQPEMGEVGEKSVKEEMEKIVKNSSDVQEEDIFVEEKIDDLDKDMELNGVEEFRKQKVDTKSEKHITEKRAEKMIQQMMSPLVMDMRKIKRFYENDRLKIKNQMNELKRYSDKIIEAEKERKRLEKKKVINFEDFNPDELVGLRNLFNEKLRSYESTMREVHLLSDHPLEKAKVFRMAFKILNSSLNILDVNSLTYMKIKILLEPSYSFYKDIEHAYQRYETDYILMDNLVEKLSDLLIDNYVVVDKIIDVFLNIVQKTESVNYDGTVGIKITSEESANIYKDIVNNFK